MSDINRLQMNSPRPFPLHFSCIAATVKTLKYLRQFFFFKGTACVSDCYQLTAVNFIKAQFDLSAVAVFYSIFDQILQTFCQPVSIAGENTVIVVLYGKLRSR